MKIAGISFKKFFPQISDSSRLDSDLEPGIPLRNELNSKSLRDTTDGSNVIDALSHHDNMVLKDMVKHSLEEVYKQLEELRQNNAAFFMTDE